MKNDGHFSGVLRCLAEDLSLHPIYAGNVPGYQYIWQRVATPVTPLRAFTHGEHSQKVIL